MAITVADSIMLTIKRVMQVVESAIEFVDPAMAQDIAQLQFIVNAAEDKAIDVLVNKNNLIVVGEI